jgi:FkbH-like protein
MSSPPGGRGRLGFSRARWAMDRSVHVSDSAGQAPSEANGGREQGFKRPGPIVSFLLEQGFTLYQFLVLPGLAAYAVAKLLQWTGLPEHMTMPMWFAAVPFLYLAWATIYMALSALEIQLLFINYEKPRYVVAYVGDPKAAKHARLLLCYWRTCILRSLPFFHVLAAMPILRRLHMLAYAPRWSYSKGLFTAGAGFFYDPDLVDVGEDVVTGGGCVISCHSMTTKGPGRFIYVSARTCIGDRVTLGGESRIGMGISIGADAIIEAGSNVVPFTQIGPGEVWGGNPAVFLRRRFDLEPATADDAQAGSAPRGATKASRTREPANDVDLRAAARKVVAQVQRLSEAEGDGVEQELDREWDSLDRMAIAATLVDAYGCRLKPEQIWQLQTLADVERVIGERVRHKCNGATVNALATAQALPKNLEWLPLLPAAQATRLLAQTSTAANEKHAPLSIVVAASFTAEPLVSSLRLWTGAFGLRTPTTFFDFNQIARALLDENSSFWANADGLNVVLLRCEDLPEDPGTAREAVDELLAAMRRFAESTSHGAKLAVATLPPLLPGSMIEDRTAANELRYYWQRALAQIAGIEIVDLAGIVEGIGLDAAGDRAMELATRAPYSDAVYRGLGIELARVARRRRYPSAKVLALDCDGTLWGGVIAEDGFDGIEIGPDGPGRSFQQFQRGLLRLKQKGVLLAVVSRNTEQDVFDVFNRHPGMVLKRSDIAAWRVNWQPKSANLQELARDLNLGLDTFVFVDDDAVNRVQVEMRLPQVHVLPLPADPVLFADTLARCWLFDNPAEQTAEDAARTEMIQQEGHRRRFTESAVSMDSYLAGLRLNVEMREAEPYDLARLAQLTQKTNQFNLSLRRRTVEGIKALDSSYRLFVLNARDRFGDYGQIGCCILHRDESPQSLVIDTFLLSCRVLGRGVEGAFLFGVAEVARRAGASEIVAPLVEGPRNAPALAFFDKTSFRREGSQYVAAAVGLGAVPAQATLELKARDFQAVYTGLSDTGADVPIAQPLAPAQQMEIPIDYTFWSQLRATAMNGFDPEPRGFHCRACPGDAA